MFFFFFNDTATTEIYTLSLHDALPIYPRGPPHQAHPSGAPGADRGPRRDVHLLEPRPPGHRRPHRRGLRVHPHPRSEEHTSELQSLAYLVCRLLLEKKKTRMLAATSLA